MPPAKQLYRELSAKGVDVLYDDTDQRAGAKFAAADLIGIPWQIMVGPKGLAEGKIEIKRRSDGSRENLSPADVVARLTGSGLLDKNYPPNGLPGGRSIRPQLAQIMGKSNNG